MSAAPAHATAAQLAAGLEAVRLAPSDLGRLELIVSRPAPGERRRLDVGRLDFVHGLLGDSWHQRPSSKMPDGGPNPYAQVTVMGVRAVRLLSASEDPDRWALAGDQLFVDFDFSEETLPVGSRVAVGDALLLVTAEPHLGCGKFARRFGVDALKAVNSDEGRALRLRGLNARVLEGEDIQVGDSVTKRT